MYKDRCIRVRIKEKRRWVNVLKSFKTEINPTAEQKANYQAEFDKIDVVKYRYSTIMDPTPKICEALRQKVSEIKEECKNIFNSEE